MAAMLPPRMLTPPVTNSGPSIHGRGIWREEKSSPPHRLINSPFRMLPVCCAATAIQSEQPEVFGGDINQLLARGHELVAVAAHGAAAQVEDIFPGIPQVDRSGERQAQGV